MSFCPQCGTKLSLVQQEMRCKCGGTFCDKHRAPEKHNCKFDYQTEQAQNLRRANPQVSRNTSSINSQAAWNKEYLKFHNPRSKYSLCHSLGFIVFLYYLIWRGLIMNVVFGSIESASMFGLFGGGGEQQTDPYAMMDPTTNSSPSPIQGSKKGGGSNGPVVILFQQLFFGIIFGYLCAHTLPHLLEKYVDGKANPEHPICGGNCRFCLFSWDTLSFTSLDNYQFAFFAEWEMLKDHILFHIITAGRTNCLSHLYTGPDRSVGHISTTVKNKLVELQNRR